MAPVPVRGPQSSQADAFSGQSQGLLTACGFFATMSRIRNSCPDMTPRLSTLPALIAIGLVVGPVTVRADAWADYARSAMTPQFTWAAPAEVLPQLRDHSRDALAESQRAEFRTALTSKVFEVQFQQTRGNDLVGAQVASASLFDAASPGLSQNLVGAQLSHEFEGGARVGAGVVVAEQQFASFGLGSEQVDSGDRLRLIGQESSTAAGVRLSLARPLANGVQLQAALQSKIDMQPFQSYRGVFSDPGDFDIPAEAELSARFALSPKLGMTFGTQHILYSELKAFSSYALPERFLSLLGDGTSPEFVWRDLTVYDVKLDYALGRASRIDFRYSTQQQPEPSSSLLYSALRDEFTDRNFALGLTHRTERAGEFRFVATHAPVEYFLGTASTLGRNNASGEQVEFEARWRVDF
jgi:hypothetical protein